MLPLTLRYLDTMWSAVLPSGDLPASAQLEHLEDFVGTLSITCQKRGITPEEARTFEIWSQAKREQIAHPERYSFAILRDALY